VPDGGVLEIEKLVCEKSLDTDASWIIHYSGENQDAAGVPFQIPSSVKIRDLLMVAPPAMPRHLEWGVIVGFANQSGLGEKSSGKGSFLVTPDAQGVRVFGLTAATAGLPCTVLGTRPILDLTPPVRA
jgi:hypothetical protein